MPHKGRLSVDKKKELVEENLSGKKSVNAISDKYGISKQTIREWIRLYKTRGLEGPIVKTPDVFSRNKTERCTRLSDWQVFVKRYLYKIWI